MEILKEQTSATARRLMLKKIIARGPFTEQELGDLAKTKDFSKEVGDFTGMLFFDSEGNSYPSQEALNKVLEDHSVVRADPELKTVVLNRMVEDTNAVALRSLIDIRKSVEAQLEQLAEEIENEKANPVIDSATPIQTIEEQVPVLNEEVPELQLAANLQPRLFTKNQ